MGSTPDSQVKANKKRNVVIVAVFVIIVVLLVPIVPVQSKVQQENVATQTLTQTRTVFETTSTTTLVPSVTTSQIVAIESEKYDVKSEWQVTWYTVTGEGRLGASVGTQTFPATFSYNWGDGPVFQQYRDYVAFEAKTTINVQRSGPVRLSVVSDDGVRLSVDGKLVINKWEQAFFGPYQESAVVTLATGKHTLELAWYEWTGGAQIAFSTDSDVVLWQETRSVTKTQTQILTTTSTSTIIQTRTSYTPYTTTTTSTQTVTVDQTEYMSIIQLLMRSRS